MSKVAFIVTHDLSAFSREQVDGMCTNMSTHLCVGKEMVFDKHVDLLVDVNVEVSSSLLSSLFILMLISDAIT